MASQKQLMKPRPYQVEMFEESMKRNVIVAMDTGSGKTHVAVLRIQAELERCELSKRVWFLAPKVALSEQQAKVVALSLSEYEQRFLCGADGVDKWTTQPVWDAVLHNVRIVICTPAILQDALTHGFVKMSEIALLVFDEAHHCTKAHPMNQIMKGFYSNSLTSGEIVPGILALTASPVRKTNPKLVLDLEANLNAKVITPQIHRSDLAERVNRPDSRIITYQRDPFLHPSNLAARSEKTRQSMMVIRLEQAHQSYDILKDPYVLEMLRMGVDRESERFQKAVTKRKTFCSEQIKLLLKRAQDLEMDLGPSVAEWYLGKCANKLKDICDRGNASLMLHWKDSEKSRLLEILDHCGCFHPVDGNGLGRPESNKLRRLFEVLNNELTPMTTCIIFATQRSTVAALTEILATTSDLKHKPKVGTFVGCSTNVAKSTNVSDLADMKSQQLFLDGFRSGDINLMVSTDVLEEGIDVPACNLIICFDPPQHLIAFVQRRGRAREQWSKYLIFLPLKSDKLQEWQSAEQVLNDIYADEERAIGSALTMEDEDEPSDEQFRIDVTGALLTLGNALSHLHHFCNTLRVQYVDPSPVFKLKGEEECHSVQVQLPALLNPELRHASSQRCWTNEKRAKQDAAFVACKQLFDAGLINNHLLPVDEEYPDTIIAAAMKAPAAIHQVRETISPWHSVATQWSATSTLHCARLAFRTAGESDKFMVMILPQALPRIKQLELFNIDNCPTIVDIHETWTTGTQDLPKLRAASATLIKAAYKNYALRADDRYVILFVPDIAMSELQGWTRGTRGYQSVPTHRDTITIGQMVYDRSRSDTPHVAIGSAYEVPTHDMSPQGQQEGPRSTEFCLKLARLPTPRDFRVAKLDLQEEERRYLAPRLVPARNCVQNGLQWPAVQPARFIPVLTHHLEEMLVAEELRKTLLGPAELSRTDLIHEAICTNFAGGPVNYQRLEFLGDCVLKTLATLNLMTEHPLKPESSLTMLKSQLVSNKLLAWTAREVGLDHFIITKRFEVRVHEPPNVQDLLPEASPTHEPTREMGLKTLADIVEALIGAAFLEGFTEDNGAANVPSMLSLQRGLLKASGSLKALIPHYKWRPVQELKDKIFEQAVRTPNPHDRQYTPGVADQLQQLACLLGYDFEHRSLLATARTHPSYSLDPTAQTYDRLEFLGDALLDLIVKTRLFIENRKLPHTKLHTVHQACVNGDILAHMAMNTATSVRRLQVADIAPHNPTTKPTVKETSSERPMWRYLLRDLMSFELSAALQNAQEAHSQIGADIDAALQTGSVYPWADLMSVGAPKCVSDMVESCLAAVWLDTTISVDAAFKAAEDLLSHLNLTPTMRRLAASNVECMTPKERLFIKAAGERVDFETVDAPNPDNTTHAEKTANADQRTMRLLVNAIEIARMNPLKLTKSEAMNAGKVSEISQARLAGIALERWDEPGSGAGIVREARARKAAEATMVKEAEKRKRESVEDGDGDGFDVHVGMDAE